MALLALVAIFGTCWAMLMPPWQSPDSYTHYAYSSSIASGNGLPGNPFAQELSSSAQASNLAIGPLGLEWATPEAKPTWSTRVARAYRDARLPTGNGGGPTPAEAYPPLYYTFAAGSYKSAVHGNALDRLNAIQLWDVALLLGSVTGAWLLAGEIFGRSRVLQLLAAAVVGLEPMNTFMSTSVNPDALLVPCWTFALWCGTRVIRRGAQRPDVAGLCVALTLAMLTKQISYALVPGVLVALALGWFVRPHDARRDLLRTYALPVMVAIASAFAWLAVLRHRGQPSLTVQPATATVVHAPAVTISRFISYLWQFYLPRLPGQRPFHVPALGLLPWPRQLPGLPVWNIWIKQGWGVFGWLDVYMPGWIYVTLGVASAVVALGVVAIVARFRDRIRLSLVAFFATVLLSLLAVLHVVEYQMLSGGNGAFNQGRYLLPSIGLLGLSVALVVSRLPRRTWGPATGLVLVGLIALQFIALGTVAKAYYT